MGNRVNVAVSKLPNPSCPACRGIGSVAMTAHFVTGDRDFEWPCWDCFGQEVRGQFPIPNSASEM